MQRGYRFLGELLNKINPISANGILAVWKPAGMSSSLVTTIIRQAIMGCDRYMPYDKRIATEYSDDFSYNKRNKMWIKVGHGGTLDRAAEGIIVIGVGRCCSTLARYLKETDKKYLFKGELGKTTETLDRDGAVIEVAPWKHITKEHFEKALEKFRGTIDQVPPLYSAKKVGGERMSDIARRAAKDKSVVIPHRPPVQITIKSLELLDFNPPFYTMSAVCSSGTYIRSLTRDIGKSLGTVSYSTSLIRTAQGEFTEKVALVEEDWTYDNIERELRKYHSSYNKTILASVS